MVRFSFCRLLACFALRDFKVLERQEESRRLQENISTKAQERRYVYMPMEDFKVLHYRKNDGFELDGCFANTVVLRCFHVK